jgi:Transcriptional regulators
MGFFKKLPNRQTACDDIIQEFTVMIKKGLLKVNDKLPSERDLAEQFGVGRSTVREALKSMTVMGLLEARPGEGTFVRNIDSESFKQLLQWSFFLNPAPIEEMVELRTLIELRMVEKAAQYRTEDHLKKLQESIVNMKKSLTNPMESKNYDLSFHLTIGNASGNKLLFNLLELIRLSLEEWFGHVLQERDFAENTIKEHELIYEAIKNQDQAAAVQHMTTHLEAAVQRLLSILTKKDEGVNTNAI